jgi:hypothetical protein
MDSKRTIPAKWLPTRISTHLIIFKKLILSRFGHGIMATSRTHDIDNLLLCFRFVGYVFATKMFNNRKHDRYEHTGAKLEYTLSAFSIDEIFEADDLKPLYSFPSVILNNFIFQYLSIR